MRYTLQINNQYARQFDSVQVHNKCMRYEESMQCHLLYFVGECKFGELSYEMAPVIEQYYRFDLGSEESYYRCLGRLRYKDYEGRIISYYKHKIANYSSERKDWIEQHTPEEVRLDKYRFEAYYYKKMVLVNTKRAFYEMRKLLDYVSVVYDHCDGDGYCHPDIYAISAVSTFKNYIKDFPFALDSKLLIDHYNPELTNAQQEIINQVKAWIEANNENFKIGRKTGYGYNDFERIPLPPALRTTIEKHFANTTIRNK